MIGFALPSTNRGNVRKESPNDFKDLLQLESRTALKLGLQQFNLQLVDVNHTGICIPNENCTSIHVNPQCKSKNRDKSALFILTDQLITTSQNKWKEG